MESAKEHVSKFLHGSGKHTAELHSHTNDAVTHETVSPTRQENVKTAVDREVHEEHHQTEVQPIHDREVLATEHHHNVLPVETRHKHHGHDQQVQEKLGSIQGAFRDKHHVQEAQNVEGKEATLVGEHHHHHVHHTVQPVVKKETIQPHVVHTTVPVHERVDLEPTVHSATVAKPMSMDHFKQQIGVGGADRREDINYKGDPLDINKDADVGFLHGGRHSHPSHQDTTSTGLTKNPTSGAHGSNIGGTRGVDDSRVTSGNTIDDVGNNSGTGRGIHNNHHHAGTGAATTGAAAAAMAASHHHRDGAGTTGNTGPGNDYAREGETIGSAATGLGHRDRVPGEHHHSSTTGTTGTSAFDPRGTDTRNLSGKMPGEYVHDSADGTGTSDTVPRTLGNNTQSGAGLPQTARETGFIDGRSPNDNKVAKEEKEGGGLISGLINKMKS